MKFASKKIFTKFFRFFIENFAILCAEILCDIGIPEEAFIFPWRDAQLSRYKGCKGFILGS